MKAKKKKKREMTVSELVSKAGKASARKRTPEQKREIAAKANAARWKDHEYSTKQSAVSQRKKRLRLKAEQEAREAREQAFERSSIRETMGTEERDQRRNYEQK